MTGISGWHVATPINSKFRDEISREATCFSGTGEIQALESNRSALWCRSRNRCAAADHAAGLIAAIEGDPGWSSPKLARVADAQGPAEALIAAYKDLGRNLFAAITGEFALAIIDDRAGEVMIGIDRMGIRPMCYAALRAVTPGAAFGSNTEAILSTGAVSSELSPQSIYNFIYFHVVPSPATIFKEIRKLEPGQFAVFSNGTWQTAYYWKPDFTRERGASVESLEREMMSTLRSATARTAPDERTGAFLSGGLDSSTVCGLANELLSRPLPVYSIGFAQDGYDELPYARIAAEHFGLQLNEYYVTPEDIAEAIPLIAAKYDEPFGNASAVPAYFCARNAQRHGLTCLLAGDGGDELFAGNERYATQQLFEYYSAIPRTLRAVLEPSAFGLPLEKLAFGRKLRRYIEQARVAMPERLQTYNLLYMSGAESVFKPDYLTDVDIDGPIRDMESWYKRPERADFVDRMLMFDWKLTLADNDIRKVTQMCDAAGIGVRFPMLDGELVDYSMRIPTRLKMPKRQIRYFFKKSMAGFLPEQVIKKTKHGFGLPFGEWLKSSASLREVVFPILGGLRTRGIFRDDFLDELVTNHEKVDAAHYGKSIWVLIMLESWLQAHQQPAQRICKGRVGPQELLTARSATQ